MVLVDRLLRSQVIWVYIRHKSAQSWGNKDKQKTKKEKEKRRKEDGDSFTKVVPSTRYIGQDHNSPAGHRRA